MFTFHHLDDRTRELMREEAGRDQAANVLYFGEWLSPEGRAAYPGLLLAAIANGDEQTLSSSLVGRFVATYQKRKPKGGFTTAKVPVTAPTSLAEGEFNRFYSRAVCRRAIDDGIQEVVVYRAKMVANPRSISIAMVGTRLNAEALLDDLRTHIGVDTALKLPPGVNSGLSVRLRDA